jgi:hypothetical protein
VRPPISVEAQHTRCGLQIEAFDPLSCGVSDWNNWYLGEILGEYVGTHRNLDTRTVRLRAQPQEMWTVNLVWLDSCLDNLATDLTPRLFDPRVVDITDRNPGNEVDLVIDWRMSDRPELVGAGPRAVPVPRADAGDRGATTTGPTSCSAHRPRSGDGGPQAGEAQRR